MEGRARPLGPENFALIVGGMKCGTTSLFEILRQHPEIAGSRKKEPGFFSDDEAWAKGWEWYIGLWDWNTARHKVALEASPAYTAFPSVPSVPERISSVKGAQFRFIYLLRNPLDQIQSNIRHTLYAGWGKPLDEGISEWMIDLVRYSTQIDQYVSRFPRDRLLLLTLEEFRLHPESVLRKVCHFLEVDPTFEFKGVSTRYNSGELYEIPDLFAGIVHSGVLRRFADKYLPRSVRHRIRGMLPKMFRRKASLGRYQLNESETAVLMSQIVSDLRRLDSEYGVDIDRFWSIELSSSAG